MALVATQAIKRIGIAGEPVSRFTPAGVWTASAIVVGDAAAAPTDINIRFDRLQTPIWYSLDRITIAGIGYTGGVVAGWISAEAVAWGETEFENANTTDGNNVIMPLFCDTVAPAAYAAGGAIFLPYVATNVNPLTYTLPKLLGTPIQATSDLITRININTNTLTIVCNATGKWWKARPSPMMGS